MKRLSREPSSWRTVRATRTMPSIAAAALLLLGSGRAVANGRFPLANQLVLDPENSRHLVARVTFGLLNSSDDGQSWQWVCEQAIGYFGIEDPAVAVTANGTTLVASSRGLSVTPDGGCSWSRRGGRFGIDVTTDPTNPHHAFAIESYLIDGAYSIFLVQSSDDGVTWNDGVLLEPNFLAETVEVASSNPDRVYVSGTFYPAGPSAVARSDDGGLTFKSFTIDAPTGESVFIGAVDPRDADVVYLRTRTGPAPDTRGRVLVSHDGAATWQEIWSSDGDVAGFALSRDGTKLAVGGPKAGVHVASTADFAFKKSSDIAVRCLTWSPAGLFACVEEAIHGFSMGLSVNEGASFTSVLQFTSILPRTCPAETPGASCVEVWSTIAPRIGIDAGGIGEADAGANQGAGDRSSRGCDCAVARRRSSLHPFLWGLIATAFAAARRVFAQKRKL